MVMFLKKSTNIPMLGVDFGSSTIKAVAVSGDAENLYEFNKAEVGNMCVCFLLSDV